MMGLDGLSVVAFQLADNLKDLHGMNSTPSHLGRCSFSFSLHLRLMCSIVFLYLGRSHLGKW